MMRTRGPVPEPMPEPMPASMRTQPPARPPAEGGLALICVLLLLAAAMVIGVAVARGAFALLASARNEGDRVTARLAAEAALLDAERDIEGTGTDPDPDPDAAARAALLAQPDGAAFVAACGRGSADLGLCQAGTPPAWQAIDLADPEGAALVPYGRYTGAMLPLGTATLPARLPGYLVERLAPDGADPAPGNVYRITAIGFGMRASTQVVLQSLYRKPAPDAPVAAGAGDAEDAEDDAGDDDTDDAGADGSDPDDAAAPGPDPPPTTPAPPAPPTTPAAPLPTGRIGWREIVNWPELHARAQQ